MFNHKRLSTTGFAFASHRGLFFGAVVGVAMLAYYTVFFFPPRLVGSNDPDRYYHLGLSHLISTGGWPKVLPQVEDLGWGNYFPDKEFLFHVLTRAADWIAGSTAVMWVVPLLGVGIALTLYSMLARVLPAGRAAFLVVFALFLSPFFLFRLTMLRPHLLAILFFCILLATIMRGRPWLAATAAAGFALTYHGLYIPLLVILVAAMFQLPSASAGTRIWRWPAAGLIIGIILNPYFPSTLLMSWIHIELALGIGLPPGLRSGGEVQPLSWSDGFYYFGFVPVAVLGSATLIVLKRIRPTPETANFWFVFVLSLILTVLSMKSARATEYATPCVIVLVGHALAIFPRRWTIWLVCTALLATQGDASWTYYRDIWDQPQGGDSPDYLTAISLLPPEADGKKVFNCQWEAGSYLLFARPGVRFVDLLEPALLWHASPTKYRARQRLILGSDPEPYRTIREVFHADYVLCGNPPLNRQMQHDPQHFEPIRGTEPMNSLRLYRVEPGVTP